MNQTISVLGCGWLGKPLAIELQKKGYAVKGSNRSNRNFDDLEANNIAPFLIDLNKTNNDFERFLDADILIIAVTSRHINNFQNFIEQIQKHQLKKVIFISSSSVYPQTNGVVTEKTPVDNTYLSKIEDQFKSNKNFQTTVIRFGGLFGYHRKPGNFFKNGRIIKDPEGLINLIHQDDCVQIIEQVIKKEIWNETLNASADTHPTRRAFYEKEMKKLGRENPIFDEKSSNAFKIVSSEKMKKLLDYSFKYPDLLDYSE